MVDYFQEATNYVIAHVGQEFAVAPGSVIEDEQFYCFAYHTKAFIETGDFSKMTVGQGYTFIVKRDNRIFQFGSRFPAAGARATLEQWLAAESRIKKYKPQFELKKRYNIQITHIKKQSVLLDILLQASTTYTIPEIVGGSIFRIPKKYDRKLLEKRLKELPAAFGGINDGISVIEKLLTVDVCEFDLLEYEEKVFAKYADKATEEDLKPIW